jgi:hypothetical protein
MRWVVLYARSRGIPLALAAILLSTTAFWALATLDGAPDQALSVLVLVAGTAFAAAGLAGQDVALDRIAAIRWPPRRAAHVLAIAVVVGSALLFLQNWGDPLSPAGVVLRDTFGLTGLTALGAALCGGQYAWTFPTGWFAFSLGVPMDTEVLSQVAGWLWQPPGTPAATAAALVLGIGGTLVYAACGNRR